MEILLAAQKFWPKQNLFSDLWSSESQYCRAQKKDGQNFRKFASFEKILDPPLYMTIFSGFLFSIEAVKNCALCLTQFVHIER